MPAPAVERLERMVALKPVPLLIPESVSPPSLAKSNVLPVKAPKLNALVPRAPGLANTMVPVLLAENAAANAPVRVFAPPSISLPAPALVKEGETLPESEEEMAAVAPVATVIVGVVPANVSV